MIPYRVALACLVLLFVAVVAGLSAVVVCWPWRASVLAPKLKYYDRDGDLVELRDIDEEVA